MLSRLPRNPATKGDEDECLGVGALQAHADGPKTFGVQSRYRAKAREAFARWNCGERVRRAAVRKAAPDPTMLEIFSRIAEKHVQVNTGLQWSVGSRLTGQKTVSVKRDHAHVG